MSERLRLAAVRVLATYDAIANASDRSEPCYQWLCMHAKKALGELRAAVDAEPCTIASHEAFKRDDAAWLAAPVPRGGDTQEIPAGADPAAEPGELHSVRNCPRCGSTLSRFRC